MESKYLVISTKTVFTVLTVFLLIFLAIELKSILIALFVGGILALGLEPAVEYLVKKKLPRGLAVLLVFSLFFGLLASLVAFALNPMVNQTISLFSRLPALIDEVVKIPTVQAWVSAFSSNIVSYISRATGDVIKATIGAFSSVFTLITIFAFTTYLLIEFGSIRKAILKILPKKEKTPFDEMLKTIELKIGAWIRGQIVLMFAVGILTFIGLTFVGIDYALSLALIAGLLEIVPIFGPILSLFPAALVGFGMSPTKGILTIVVYIVIQQLENNLLVPKVMQRAVGFNPLITMIAVLVGGKLFGILGVLFAVPVTLILLSIWDFFQKEKQTKA